MTGYSVIAYCTREDSPDEPSLYDLLEEIFQEQQSIQRAIALNQKSLSAIEGKLDERKRPKVEVGYR